VLLVGFLKYFFNGKVSEELMESWWNNSW